MPTYLYVCEVCHLEEEILHSAKDCDNPLNIVNIRNKYCKLTEENKCDVEQCTLRRKPCLPAYNSFSSKTPAEKQKQLKERSHEHFEKHIKEKFHEMNKPGYIP